MKQSGARSAPGLLSYFKGLELNGGGSGGPRDMLDRVIADRVGSRGIADRVGSRRIAWDRVGSRKIAWDRVGSRRIAWDRVGSRRIAWA